PLVRRADGALRCRAARTRAPRLLRAAGGRHRARGAARARVLRSALRARLPALLRERARRARRELRAGAGADLSRGARAVAALRSLARAAQAFPRGWARSPPAAALLR